MFPYYKGPEETKDLDYDDIMALYELYSKKLVILFAIRSLEKKNILKSNTYLSLVKSGVSVDNVDPYARDGNEDDVDVTMATTQTTTTTTTTNTEESSQAPQRTTASYVEINTEPVTKSSRRVESTSLPSSGIKPTTGCETVNSQVN